MLPIIICDEQIEFKYKIMEFSFRSMTQKKHWNRTSPLHCT